MIAHQNGIFSVSITRPGLERLSVAALDEVARGILFVPAAVPPRVGARVQVDVAVCGGPSSRQDGLVIWSRPARPGLAAGFRVLLPHPSPTMMRRLKSTVDVVRDDVARRSSDAPSAELERPVIERVSARTDPPRVPPPPATPVPADLLDFPIVVEAAPSSGAYSRIRPFRRDQPTLPPPMLALPGPPSWPGSQLPVGRPARGVATDVTEQLLPSPATPP